MRGLISLERLSSTRSWSSLGVGDSDQSRLGRGEQQAADGAVDGAVADVEHVLGLRVRGEPLVEPAQVIVVDG